MGSQEHQNCCCDPLAVTAAVTCHFAAAWRMSDEGCIFQIQPLDYRCEIIGVFVPESRWRQVRFPAATPNLTVMPHVPSATAPVPDFRRVQAVIGHAFLLPAWVMSNRFLRADLLMHWAEAPGGSFKAKLRCSVLLQSLAFR